MTKDSVEVGQGLSRSAKTSPIHSTSKETTSTSTDAVLPCTPQKQENVTAMPFFIMDWLEEVNPADLEQAQRMLKTPKPTVIKSRNAHVKSTSPFSLASFVMKTMICPSSSENNMKLHNAENSNLKSVARDLFTGGGADNSTPTPSGMYKKDATTTTIASTTTSASYYRKRSIAIGNGWNAKGLAKAKQGLWQDALACWENALAVRTQVLGPDHIDVANTCNNMGIAVGKLQQEHSQQQQQHYSMKQAMGLLQQALEIRQAHYGRKHPEVAATLHNIGNVLQQSGDLEQAIEYFTQAKDLQQDLLGEEHVQVARAWRAMGHAYYQGQRFAEAHRAYCEALRIFEQLHAFATDGSEKKSNDDGFDDYSNEIEATCADVQELNELMHEEACKRNSPKTVFA